MKVMLLVNLKTAGGQIVPKGSVFSDEYQPLPGFISRKIGTNLIQILNEKPTYEVVDPVNYTMEAPVPRLDEIMIEKQSYVEPEEKKVVVIKQTGLFVNVSKDEEDAIDPDEEVDPDEEIEPDEEVDSEEDIKEVFAKVSTKKRSKPKSSEEDTKSKKRRTRSRVK